MLAEPNQWRSLPEDILAELTDSAYRVVLHQGFKGSFLDLELGLWQALRGVFARPRPFEGAGLAQNAARIGGKQEAGEPAIVAHLWSTAEDLKWTA